MIVTKHIDVKITMGNIKRYLDMGYEIRVGDNIKIPVALLSKHSHVLIELSCDICGLVKKTEYKTYLKYKCADIYGSYKCRKCIDPLRIETTKKNKICQKEDKENLD